MSKFQRVVAIVAVPLLLSGCGETKNVQTLKSADYVDMPHNIFAVVEAPELDSRFNDAFVDSASRCGAQVAFVKPSPGQPAKMEGADGVLVIHELAYETSKLTHPGLLNGQPWISMIRLQVSLNDPKSKKVVWTGQADFTVGQFSTVHEDDPTQRWGDDLARLMLKDKLFAGCNFNRKTVPAAAKTAP